MRTIPAPLLDKINLRYRTLYSEADPRTIVTITPQADATWTPGDPWEPGVSVDISDYVQDCSIRGDISTPVKSVSLTVANVGGLVTEDADLPTGAKIEVSFQAGDSTSPYAMGVFYVDRAEQSVTEPTIAITGRNTCGRLLSDQSFNATRNFFDTAWNVVIADILDYAGIPNTDYFVGAFDQAVTVRFERDKSLLAGLEELIKLVPTYIIYEIEDGDIGIAPADDARFPQPSDYEFERDTDVWGRKKSTDDIYSYARVGVKYRGNRYYYAEIAGAKVPAQKTYFVEIDALLSGATAYGDALAGYLAGAGRVEEFIGPIRPHITERDTANITDTPGGGDRGDIVQFEHVMSSGGYATRFIVDSAGFRGRPNIMDYIQRARKKQDMEKAFPPDGLPPDRSSGDILRVDEEDEADWQTFEEFAEEIKTDILADEAFISDIADAVEDEITEGAVENEIWVIDEFGDPQWVPGGEVLGEAVTVAITGSIANVDWKGHTPRKVEVYEDGVLINTIITGLTGDIDI